MADVEAVVIAGGLGTRLRPLTTNTPKHLLPLAGVPLVAHQLAKLAEAGVTRVILATSYRADQFEPVLGDGSRWGVELVYVTEKEPLGTAGAIRHVASALRAKPSEPLVVYNGDILSGHDLRGQLDYHRRAGADVTLHLVEVPDARPYGCVPTDVEGRVTAFLEKSPEPESKQINAGCYVFSRHVVDEIPSGRAVSVERETFPGLLAAGRLVVGFVDDSYWLDVGSPAALCRGSSDVVRGLLSTPAYQHPPGERYVDPTAAVDEAATVIGGSCIGPAVTVEADARVEGSVLMPGSAVAAGAQVVDSVLGQGARVGAGAVLRDAVVGDRARIGAQCELLAGARVWNDVTIPDGAIRFSPDE